MLLALAAILLICWLAGLIAFHVTAAVFHLVLVVAIVLLVLHFVGGRRGAL